MVVLLATTCSSSVEEPRSDLFISNVHLFLEEAGAFSDPTSILIRDGRIVEVGPLISEGQAEATIDGGGAFALPGLWDSHVHLSPLALGGADSVAAQLARFVNSGVLYVRDMGGPINVIAPMAEHIATDQTTGPRIFFAGPMAERPPLYWEALNEQLPGFTVPIESTEDVDKLVVSVADAGGSLLKVFGKWDRELLRRLLMRAREEALRVALDPGLPFFQDVPVDTALVLGITSIEHAHSAWQSVLPDNLKAAHDSVVSGTDMSARAAYANGVIPLGKATIDSAALSALGRRWAAAGAYFCPTLRVAEHRRSEPPALPGAPSKGDLLRFWGGYADAATEITRVLSAEGVPLLIGQDGQDASATVEEMELLVRIGVPPEEVLRAATIHPARWMGMDRELGSLVPGKTADLVITQDDPLKDIGTLRRPLFVIQNGVIRHRSMAERSGA